MINGPAVPPQSRGVHPASAADRYLPYDPEPRVSPAGVADIVVRAIAAGTPLSVVRLGDGEFPLLGLDVAPREQVTSHLDGWFGPAHPPDAALVAFADELRAAVRSADVVGLPRVSRQQADPCCAYVRRVFECHRLHEPGTIYTDCGIHHYFQLMLSFDEMLRGRSFVGLVTCRDVRAALADIFGIREILWHAVPADYETSRVVPELPHYPDVYEALRRDLAPPFAGAVYLVGAGPFGKVYCAWIRERGGIAVDIGSLFDAWAGLFTRPRHARLRSFFSLDRYRHTPSRMERMAAYRRIVSEQSFGIAPTGAELEFLLQASPE